MIDLLYAIQPIEMKYELEYEIKTQKLTPISLKFPEEHLSFKSFLVRLTFSFLSLGKAYAYYAIDGNKVVHSSIVVPRCSKFQFMEDNTFEVGPCFTDPHYRGRKIYTNMLKRIINDIAKSGGKTCYMLVNPNNKASINGIERAGFKLIGKAEKTRLLKRYKQIY